MGAGTPSLPPRPAGASTAIAPTFPGTRVRSVRGSQSLGDHPPTDSSMRRTCLTVTPLEAREVPATLVSPTTVTYQDVDGDLVTVVATKPVFTSMNKNTVFTFDTGDVSQSNATKQQLWEMNLSMLGAAAAGTGLSVTATRTANGGDGRVNVGAVVAQGVNLGPVVIGGDLGRIEAGSQSALVPAVAGLTVRSMGRFSLDTQNPVGASLVTFVQGRVAKLVVRSDVIGAQFKVVSATPVGIGSVMIGGSLRGEGAMSFNGSIRVTGGIGSVAVRGDVEGTDGKFTGQIQATGNIGPVTIGGSL